MTNGEREATGEWFDGMAEWTRLQRLLLGAFGVCLLALVAAAPVTWLVARPVQSSSSVPPPTWTMAAFASGDAMRQLERHVKESSWVTFQLRGAFNETLLRFGVLNSDRVVFGRDGWMYLPETMQWKPELLQRTRDRRRAIMQQALDLTRSVGIQLLVVPTPDKVTIYPEFAAGQLDPGRERLYDEILADLTAVGVPHIDVRALFVAHRQAHPDQLLYHRRGTHWQDPGQRIVAGAVRRRIEAEGWGELLRPEPSLVLLEPRPRNRVPGLVRLLGLRCENEIDHPGLSDVVRSLMEPTVWRPVFVRKPDGQLAEIAIEQPTAAVALCGSSFSETLGLQLCGELGTLVDRRCVLAGGGSFSSMRKLVREVMARSFLPRIVVWEFVQRDFQNDWTTARSLLD